MNTQDFLNNAIPKSGLGHWAETFATWSGVGLIGAFIANLLDEEANLAYAAYYTNAVNDAIAYPFWVLLAVIAILLFFMALPLMYWSETSPKLQTLSDYLRRLAYVFFLVAFDEGCLMIGILSANFLHTSDRINLLANKSFLFSNMGFLSILALAMVNSLLWWLGESLYNRDDKSYSGIVNLLRFIPVKYLIPLYLLIASLSIYLITQQ